MIFQGGGSGPPVPPSGSALGVNELLLPGLTSSDATALNVLLNQRICVDPTLYETVISANYEWLRWVKTVM